MEQLKRIHPLDRLIEDDSLFFLEAMIPFVDSNAKKLLVVLIKFKEISSIMNSLNNPAILSERGFNCHPKNTDEFIADMCNFMPEDYKNKINNIQQIMSMMKLMNFMEETKDCSNKSNNISDFFSDNISDNDSCNNNSSLYDSIMSIIDNEGC